MASLGETPSTQSSTPANGQRRRNRNRPRPNNSRNGQASSTASEADSSPSTTSHAPSSPQNHSNRPSQRIRQADPSRVVRKPQRSNPQKLNKRDQEIEQLRRGFPTLTNDEDDPTKFYMKLIPSDPDFPFDIQSLEFNLYVPLNYPSNIRASSAGDSRMASSVVFPMIVVLNEDIPRGFSINIDMGFKSLSERFAKSGKTLLDMIVALDRELEGFLKQGKRETIKIVKMNNNRAKTLQSEPIVTDKSEISGSHTTPSFSLNSAPTVFVPPEVRKERQSQIDKLKHSLGESSMWMVSSDKSEDVYGISVTSSKPSELPAEMNGDLTFNLHIPSSYGISEPCFAIFPTIIDGFPSNLVENNFNKFARAHQSWKLFSLVNFLACRVGDLMSETYEDQDTDIHGDEDENEVKNVDETAHVNAAEVQDKARKILTSLLKKPSPQTSDDHVEEPAQSLSEDDMSEEDEVSAVEEESIFNLEPIKPRGIALLLPSMSMTNVGILECNTINLVVKCDRCDTQNDLFNIVSGPYGRESKPVASTCTKCKAVLACSFQKNLMHQNSNGPPTVGYLDMSGCAPADILGSTFVPTCENCTTSNHDGPFKRVESQRMSTLNCRSCHIRMTLQLGEDGFRFEQVDDEKLSAERLKGVRVKKPDLAKQKLGLSSGQPLPDDGKCTHYRKSTRWYRFSCCGKVFPCDKCHDQESNHPFEHGTRIICGKCSREQNFTSTCAYCHHKFDNRNNTGFWEGGKGTRDQTKLNRNDRRKYKRVNRKEH